MAVLINQPLSRFVCNNHIFDPLLSLPRELEGLDCFKISRGVAHDHKRHHSHAEMWGAFNRVGAFGDQGDDDFLTDAALEKLGTIREPVLDRLGRWE